MRSTGTPLGFADRDGHGAGAAGVAVDAGLHLPGAGIALAGSGQIAVEALAGLVGAVRRQARHGVEGERQHHRVHRDDDAEEGDEAEEDHAAGEAALSGQGGVEGRGHRGHPSVSGR